VPGLANLTLDFDGRQGEMGFHTKRNEVVEEHVNKLVHLLSIDRRSHHLLDPRWEFQPQRKVARLVWGV